MKTAISVAIIAFCVGTGIYLFYQDAAHKEMDRRELKKKLAACFYCDACEKEFLAEGGVPSTPCPECGEDTSVIRLRKRCERCEYEFVAYEHDIRTNQQRYPEGDWHTSVDIDIPCPQCNNKKLISLPE